MNARNALMGLLAVGTWVSMACSSPASADTQGPENAESAQQQQAATVDAGGAILAEKKPGRDDHPGRGRTASFEVAYLKLIIDHHFGVLRMTELAAGTASERAAELDNSEGTAPTPGFRPVRARAALSNLRSLARRDNRLQREEILSAQDMLRHWYGIDYAPRLTADARAMIEELQSTPAGETFDQRFIELVSRHHFSAVVSSAECQVSRELDHQALETFCRNVVVTQVSGIQDMRQWDCDQYGVCDLQPVEHSQVLARP